MFDLICVTNRQLCKNDFLVQLKQVAAAHPAGLILREKDLTEQEYRILAAQVLEICSQYQVPCILHSFVQAAIELKADRIHLPLPLFQELTPKQRQHFTQIGVSCHSIADAQEAQRLGCTYITAGHVFDTDCKRGLPGRGLFFLQEICQAVTVPVYAIGGITAGRIGDVRRAGAHGACLMSSFMNGTDIPALLASLKAAGDGRP